MLQETLLAAWRGIGQYEGRAVTAHLAVPDRDQPLAERAARQRPPSAAGTARAAVRGGDADPARASRSGCSRTRTPCSTACPTTIAGPDARLRGQGDDRAGVRRRRPAPAAAAARGPAAARRTRLPVRGGRGHPRHQRGVGEQRPAAGQGHDDGGAARPGPRPRAAAAVGEGTRAGAAVRGGLRRRRCRRRGGAAHRRRLVHHAARHARVPGSRRDRELPGAERALPGRPAHAADPDPGERPARVRLLRARRARRDLPRARCPGADHGGERISAITRFVDSGLLPHFGLPRTLPGHAACSPA